MPTTRSDFVIDTDTASDDAVALIMALRAGDVSVRAITTVAGNVNVEQASRNALLVTELCDVNVPVYAGCARPLLHPPLDANWFHGKDGLSDQGFAPTTREPQSQHAVDALIEASHNYPGLTLVTLGPLTNIAVALRQDRTLADRIGRCVIMGGNPCCVGNISPAAEYNIWCDPHAAQIVFTSGMNIEMVGWHLSRGDAVLHADDISQIQNLNTALARFAIESNTTAALGYQTQTGEVGISLPDPVAMAVAIDPSITTHATNHLVQIETQSDLTRGMTVVDQLDLANDQRNTSTWGAASPAKIVWSIDISAFKKRVAASLA